MSPRQPFRLATRGSKLALWQANHIAGLLKAMHCETELNVIKTTGDIVQDRFLHEIGGKGLFVKELEQAMVDGTADFAVHSLKDLPVRLPAAFDLVAIRPRHVSYDVMILRKDHAARLGFTNGDTIGKEAVKKLQGMTIGSSSLRRQSLLRGLGTPFNLQALRGNVDTRLKKLEMGEWDAIILAGASLERLEIYDVAAYPIDPEWFVPCAAQGALAIETLMAHPVHPILRGLNDMATEAAVTCERKVLRILGGDCTMPFGCLVEERDDGVRGQVVILANDGQEARAVMAVPGTLTSFDGDDLAFKLVSELLRSDGDKILRSLNLAVPNLTKG